MRKSIIYACLGLASFSAIGAILAHAAGSSAPPYKLTAIKAYLFFDQQNTFSKELLTDPDLALWNTVIGEGSAGSPSHQTLVVVEVTGPPDAYDTSRQIEFTVVEGGTVLLKRTAATGILSATGKYYEAFLLNDVGLSPVKLSARLLGQAQASKLEKTIPFAGGE